VEDGIQENWQKQYLFIIKHEEIPMGIDLEGFEGF
jgi:hypothetical protein